MHRYFININNSISFTGVIQKINWIKPKQFSFCLCVFKIAYGVGSPPVQVDITQVMQLRILQMFLIRLGEIMGVSRRTLYRGLENRIYGLNWPRTRSVDCWLQRKPSTWWDALGIWITGCDDDPLSVSDDS